MSTLSYGISLEICWFVSFFSYLTSTKQVLITPSLDKRIFWPIFVTGMILATIIQAHIFHWLAAIIIVWLTATCSWIFIVIASPYLLKPKWINTCGCAAMVLLAAIGGNHVA